VWVSVANFLARTGPAGAGLDSERPDDLAAVTYDRVLIS
jgi:hypothetical protein